AEVTDAEVEGDAKEILSAKRETSVEEIHVPIKKPEIAEDAIADNNPPNPEFDHLYKNSESISAAIGTKIESITTPDGLSYEIINDSARISIKEGGEFIAKSSVDTHGLTTLQLEDRFQDGPQFTDARKAYVDALNRIDKPAVGKTVIPYSFENGIVEVAKGDNFDGGNPNSVRVLLNGKIIAHGEIGDKSVEITFDKNLKTGPFLQDNAYERAF